MNRLPRVSNVGANHYVTVFMALVVGILLAIVLTEGALSSSKAFKYIDAKIKTEVVGSVRLANLGSSPPLGPFVWCFKDVPAFAFVQGRKVMLMTFGGSLQEIMSSDRPLGGEWLECSDDGKVVTVLSRDSSELFIKNGPQLGHYKTDLSSPRGSLQIGHILSPGGTIIAIPFNISFSSGDDVVPTIRVLHVDGDNFSWNNGNLLYVNRTTSSVLSYNTNTNRVSTITSIAERYPDKTYHVHNIVSCAKANIMSLFLRTSDSTESGGSVILDLNRNLEVATERGELSSVVANGHKESVCIISRATMVALSDVTKYELLFEDGLAKYSPLRGIDFGYDVALAPRNCMVLGTHYVFGKDGAAVQSDTSVVAIRITRSGRCGG
jgi:hypothetical protein